MQAVTTIGLDVAKPETCGQPNEDQGSAPHQAAYRTQATSHRDHHEPGRRLRQNGVGSGSGRESSAYRLCSTSWSRIPGGSTGGTSQCPTLPFTGSKPSQTQRGAGCESPSRSGNDNGFRDALTLLIQCFSMCLTTHAAHAGPTTSSCCATPQPARRSPPTQRSPAPVAAARGRDVHQANNRPRPAWTRGRERDFP